MSSSVDWCDGPSCARALPDSLRVLYDASMLGEGFGNVAVRTGIYRSVESVAIALNARSDIDISLTASASWGAALGLREYLTSHGDFKGTTVQSSRRFFDSVIARGHPAMSWHVGGSRSWKRAMRLADRAISRVVPPFSSRLTREFDVFHAPSHALPQGVDKQRGPVRFLTIYDLIAIVRPEFGTPRLRRVFERVRRSIRPEDFLITDSLSARQDVIERWNIEPERVFVAHLAASTATFRPVHDAGRIEAVRRRYAIPPGNYVLSVNALDRRKNVQLAIRSFIRMIREERIPDLNLVLVWNREWDPSQLFDSAEDAALARQRIHVTGFVAEEDMAAVYSGARCFVYPSFYEGFGLPVLEAMQCGLPVLTSNTSSLPEVVGTAGVMVDPADADAFAAALLLLYKDDEARKRLARAAILRASMFTWHRTAERIVEAYRAGLAATGSGRALPSA